MDINNKRRLLARKKKFLLTELRTRNLREPEYECRSLREKPETCEFNTVAGLLIKPIEEFALLWVRMHSPVIRIRARDLKMPPLAFGVANPHGNHRGYPEAFFLNHAVWSL